MPLILATTSVLPSRTTQLPLVPLMALLFVIRDIFLVAKSIEQRRSSQLKSAERALVRIQRFGVPNLLVSKVLISNVGVSTAVRIWLGFGIVVLDAPSHIAKALLEETDKATS